MTSSPETGPIAVSFIVPVHNVEDYISDCVSSLLRQRLPNSEVLLVNDGSTDGSREACQAFACLDSRVRVITQPNRGLSSARNEGLRQAVGEYVCFVDADDWLDDEIVPTLYATCREWDLDILRFAYYRADDSGEEIDHKVEQVWAHTGVVLMGPDFLNQEISQGAYEVVAPAAMFRRAYLESHQLAFRVGRTHEDHEFFLRSLLVDDSVRVQRVATCAYAYRIRSGSITKSPTLKNVIDILSNVASMTTFVSSLHISRDRELVARRAISALFYQLTSIYTRLPIEERREADRIVTRAIASEMARTPFDLHQGLKLWLFAHARATVPIIYSLKQTVQRHQGSLS